MKEEYGLDLKLLKKLNWTYVFLIIFVILGFYLRAYHIDFPSIGYHNMKENEYLGETIIFNQPGSDLLHRINFEFFGLEDGPGYFEEYAQAPLIPYMTLPFWKIFGEQIWIPRLIVMLFMLGSIVLIYFIIKLLTKNEYLSLLSSFLLTIMPLGVYFGRNIQPESPALFCVLLSTYFYIKWSESLNKKELLYSFIALSFGGLFKMTFLIAVVPLLFITPYQKLLEMWNKNKKEFFNQVKFAIIGLLPFIIIQSIFELAIVDPSKRGSETSLQNFVQIFGSKFWNGIWPSFSSYLNDNYTWWFVWFAILGVAFVILKYRTKLSRFLIGELVALPIYLGLVSGKLGGHAYYQMPFLPLIVILSAYFIFNIGLLLKQVTGVKYSEFASLLLILLTLSAVNAADDRVWNTIFFGQDVIGQYIQEHTSSTERFINIGHDQTFAVCTYAKRRCGSFQNVTDLMQIEKRLNIKYLNFDAYSVAKIQQEDNASWNYIINNYRVVLAGVMNQNNKPVIYDLLLERGGKFNITDLQNKQPILAETYDTKMGKLPYYIVGG